MRDVLTGIGVTSLLVILTLFAGCSSVAIGDVSYGNGTLAVPVTSTSGPSDAFIQVTVYTITDFHQEELITIQQPVSLATGINTLTVPLPLEPGRYKLYIYILKPDERQTATIRDIVV